MLLTSQKQLRSDDDGRRIDAFVELVGAQNLVLRAMFENHSRSIAPSDVDFARSAAAKFKARLSEVPITPHAPVVRHARHIR